MNFKQFLNEDIHLNHCIRKICKCGNTITCRCRTPKTDVFVESCQSCQTSPIKDLISVARQIKHCGDYGYLFYNDITKSVYWTGADSDSNKEYTSTQDIRKMFLQISGVENVQIEAEHSPDKNSSYSRINYK